VIYLDTSALIKLYLREPDSAAVNAIVVGQDEPLPIWFLHGLELRNAFSIKVFRKELTAAEADGLTELFEARRRSGIYVAPRLEVDELAAAAMAFTAHTRRLGCGSLDILHVAAAKLLAAPRFVTCDERQRQLAVAVGLNVT
jgi:predicted nucleic acid-binding protein